VHSIGFVAQVAGVSVRVLRHYDEIGLFKPARVDPASGYRSYEPSQIDQLHRVLALKELGFSLSQVRRMIDDAVSTEEMRGMLRLRRTELAAQIEETSVRLRRVEAHLLSLDRSTRTASMKEFAMSPADIVIKAVPAMTVAAVSAVSEGFGPDRIGPVLQPLFPRLFELIERHGLQPSGPTMALYDDASDGDGVLCSAAVPIGERPSTFLPDLEIRDLPAWDRAVTVLHHGPMTTIGESYAHLTAAVVDRGYTTLGYSREIYLDCPADTTGWITELQFGIDESGRRSR
jgi:DNA-binding transcriptional MerR regulator/effector-binding domain-containing protein